MVSLNAPKQITLDLDATDDPLHGHQEGRFFHGYYDCFCYLALYMAEKTAAGLTLSIRKCQAV